MSQLIAKLIDVNKKMRAESTCPVCGLPREGFRAAVGVRVVDSYDETGTESQECVGGRPESFKRSGLCLCERAYFYSAATGLKLFEHWAQGGIFVGFEPFADGVLALDLIIESGQPPRRVTASNFDEPVRAEILAPDQNPETIRFPLGFGFAQIKEVA